MANQRLRGSYTTTRGCAAARTRSIGSAGSWSSTAAVTSIFANGFFDVMTMQRCPAGARIVRVGPQRRL